MQVIAVHTRLTAGLLRPSQYFFATSELFSRLALICCLLCSAFASGVRAQIPTGQEEEVIRTETDLTNLLFAATDKNNRFITTLQQQDIRVLEDGVEQKLFTFQRETDRPLSIAFLIDVSVSEERTLPDEKAAARTFIETIIRSSKDQAAIIPFEGYAHLEQPLTRDMLSVYRILQGVEIAGDTYMGKAPAISGIASGPGMIAPPEEGSTAIWDAVALTSREVLVRSPGQKRCAIILADRRARYEQPPGSQRSHRSGDCGGHGRLRDWDRRQQVWRASTRAVLARSPNAPADAPSFQRRPLT